MVTVVRWANGCIVCPRRPKNNNKFIVPRGHDEDVSLPLLTQYIVFGIV